MTKLYFAPCSNCNTHAQFERVEDGTYILWAECECGEFNEEAEPYIPEYKRGELVDEERRTPDPIFGDEEPF